MKKIIICSVFFILFICNVKAAEINIDWMQEVYVNRIEDGYIYWNQFGFVHSNDIPLYCVEVDMQITTHLYNEYGYDSFELSDEDKIYLELIAYYGYMYKDHYDYRYYMATQELIWNMLGIDIYWTTQKEGNGNIIDISQYKSEILNLYNEHNLKPDFNIMNFDIKVGSSIILEDSNNLLHDYNLIYNGDNVVKKQNNQLIVESYSLGNDYITLSKNINNNYETTVYRADNSQTLIGFGNVEHEDVNIYFNVYGGSVLLKSVDFFEGFKGESTLEGAIYGVFDENYNLINSFETDIEGYSLVSDLPLGNYIIKQISPSKGYQSDEIEYFVSLEFGDVDKVLFLHCILIQRRLKIEKTFEGKSGNVEPEPNIKFKVYNPTLEFIDYLITDENGIGYVYLPYGSYIISQINSTEGYKKTEKFIFDVKVSGTSLFEIFNEKEKTEESEMYHPQEPSVIEDDKETVISKLPSLYEKSSVFYCKYIYLIFVIGFLINAKKNKYYAN